MKKLLMLTVLVFLTNRCLIAQNEENETSTNSMLVMKSFAKDSLAEAVIISDVGKSFFESESDGSFALYFERKTRFKVFKKAGLKWGQIEIPFYETKDDLEKVYDIEGVTYNYENGIIQKTPLVIEKRLEEKIDANRRVLKIAMPNVKVGSVFEISYTIHSPFFFNFRGWEFQHTIPVIYSEYRTHMNPFYEYIYILQGTNEITSLKSFVDPGMSRRYGGIEYKDMIYEFVMKDIPAFRDETFISSSNDYMINLNFQLSKIHYPNGSERKIMTSWPNLSSEMLSNYAFGGFLSAAEKKAKSIVDTMHFNTTDVYEKAKIIERYVKDKFSWNGENTKFADLSLKDFLKAQKGNSAEINLFLLGMLNAAGIEASPVVLSTRGHGKIPSNYPFLHFFNYVIVLATLDNDAIPLDATDPLSDFSEIPSRCYNDNALVVKKKDPQWISIKKGTVSSSSYAIDITPDPVKEVSCGKIKIRATGYDALNLRDQYLSDFKKFKTNVLSSLTLNDSIRISNLQQVNKSFDVDFGVRMPLEKVENKLIITPFCNFTLSENPLKQFSRSYPVDMNYKKGKKFISIIHIPDGYKLYSKPQDYKINTSQGKIVFTSEIVNGNTIKLSGEYEFAKDIYDPQEYIDLKGFFNKIVDKLNEKVICVKG